MTYFLPRDAMLTRAMRWTHVCLTQDGIEPE